jgi:hypothetical protein
MTPREKISYLGEYCFAYKISGAKYPTVPSTTSVVIVLLAVLLRSKANPKSHITTSMSSPSEDLMSTLSGFKSLWIAEF